MKVAIVELSGSHDECIYSQLKFIKSLEGVSISLFCSRNLQNNIEYFDLVDNVYCIDIHDGLKGYLHLRMLAKQIRQHNFNKVILNTAQGRKIMRLLKHSLGKNTEIIGILHNLRKLNGSNSQKKISAKLKKYYLLSDYLTEKVDKTKHKKLQFGAFYPIFFPEYPEQKLKKKKGEIWISIPGQVELKRRDYKALFDALETEKIAEHIKFILLGRSGHQHGDGAYIKRRLKTLEIKNKFIIWDDFVQTDLFYSYLKKSDYIMPLIHSGHQSFELYEYQITGAFNLAYGYKIPLLMEDSLKNIQDFKETSVFYNQENVIKVINNLKPVEEKNSFDIYQKWTFECQKEKYLALWEMD